MLDAVLGGHENFDRVCRWSEPRPWIVGEVRVSTGVEQDVFSRVLDQVEEVSDDDLCSNPGVERVRGRSVGTLAAAMEREQFHGPMFRPSGVTRFCNTVSVSKTSSSSAPGLTITGRLRPLPATRARCVDAQPRHL
jgi:hypothetical protein